MESAIRELLSLNKTSLNKKKLISDSALKRTILSVRWFEMKKKISNRAESKEHRNNACAVFETRKRACLLQRGVPLIERQGGKNAPWKRKYIGAGAHLFVLASFKSDHKQKTRSSNFAKPLGRMRALRSAVRIRAQIPLRRILRVRGEAFCLRYWGGEKAGRFHGGSLIRENYDWNKTHSAWWLLLPHCKCSDRIC